MEASLVEGPEGGEGKTHLKQTLMEKHRGLARRFYGEEPSSALEGA